MKLKYFSFFGLLVLCLFVFSESVFACSGIFPEKPICIKYAESEVVLIGEVIKTTTFTKKGEDKDDSWKFRRTIFKIEKQFKGEKKRTIEFITPAELRNSCDLSPKFKIGEKWLIYASNSEDEKQLKLYKYSWKYNPTKNKKDLEFLENAALGIRETSLQIQIEYWTNLFPESIGVLDINVSGLDFNLSTQTTKCGNLMLPNLRNGLYKVTFTTPPYSSIMNLPSDSKKKFIEDSKQYLIEQEVEIKDGECVFSHFALGSRN